MFKKTLIVGIILSFICMSISPSVAIYNLRDSSIQIYNGNTLYVGGTGEGNYTIIQDAIDNATDGDTVFVYNGTYFENLFLDKTIYLIGEDRNNTIIYPKNLSENQNSIVYISADACTIDGFTLGNYDLLEDSIGFFINSSKNKINGSVIKYLEHGIYIKDKVIYKNSFIDNQISNNEITNCTFGVYIRSDGKDNVIYNNDIFDNTEGIYISYCVNNSIVGNFVHSNSVYGIYISTDSDGNIVSRNVITENKYGIRFQGVNYNEIFLNWFQGNEQGLYSCCSSCFNTIYKNTCIDNEKHASDGYHNNWDNGELGNYWDNYNGTDNDGDGIGDTPYPIPGGNNEDRYPLMEPPWSGNQPPESPTIDGPTKCKSGIEYDYYFVANDPDGDHIWYHICWGNEELIYIYGPYPSGEKLTLSYNWADKGTYMITCWARDIYNEESNVTTLEINVPRSKEVNNSFFNWFLERFPLFDRLLYFLKKLCLTIGMDNIKYKFNINNN